MEINYCSTSAACIVFIEISLPIDIIILRDAVSIILLTLVMLMINLGSCAA